MRVECRSVQQGPTAAQKCGSRGVFLDSRGQLTLAFLRCQTKGQLEERRETYQSVLIIMCSNSSHLASFEYNVFDRLNPAGLQTKMQQK